MLLAGGCGGGGGSRSYATDLADADYQLDAMQLANDDMPEKGLQSIVSDSFTNEEWAQVFAQRIPSIDPAQKTIQLEAQGRVRGYVSVFSWDDPVQHLGRIQEIESHSTLYTNEEAASRAISQSACGLLIADDKLIEEFTVPAIGDESTGFFNEDTIDYLGKSVDTVVCFRTGRIVHAILQNGLDGTQDIDVSVQLARRMLTYVDASFDGKDRPVADGGG